MAPTSRTDRRRWNSKGDIKDQFDDNTANAKESVGDINLEGKLWRRALLQLLGRDGDKDEDESEDESEDEHEHGDDRSNVGLPITNPIPHPSLPSFPPPPPLPPLPSNPLSGLFPPPKSSPPPNSNPPAAAPPPQQPPPPSSSIPPQVSPTGVTGNFGSASPSANPRRTTLSAALPKSTSGGDDSDDDDDDDDGSTTSGAPSPTRSTFSKSTRSVLSLTAAISPYETYTTEEGGQKSSISSSESTTRSPTTSTTAPAQTPETATRVETAMTGIPSPNGTAAIGQGQEAARTSRLSPGAEKAVIASVTIGGFFLLLVLALFFWRRASKQKSTGRKSTWPTNSNSPSREIFAGPRRVSTKLGEKFTSLKAHEILEGPRRVSNKVGENFTSMKAHIRSGSLGWCSINDDDDDTPTNEKSAAPVATNAGGLLERRLGAMTPPQRVTVNSYGMIFRKPKRDSRLSDIFQPRGQQRTWPPSIPPSPEVPPSPEGIRIPIVRPNTQMAAAAHLENARKSVNAGMRNMPRTPRTPLRQNMRMSDVSSLSSGFGDGDIVIIQPPNAATAAKTAYTDSHVNVIAVRSSPERKHFSSRFSDRLSRGETVGTNSSSEDGRPRFRSISSWVGQQSRRVRRAAANRNEDGVPDVPDVPPEQGFDMMMPDGQEPRRVESSMWKKTGGAV